MQNKSGQGLIETLIVILVIFISAAIILNLSRTLSTNNDNSKQRTDALVIANSKMDDYRSFTVLSTTAGYFAYQDIVTGSSTSTVSGITYTLTTTVTTYTNPDYKNVRIVVSWSDKEGVAQSVTVVSNIASLDPAAQVS